jgi:hypothetical protein
MNGCSSGPMVESTPNILVYTDRLICSPNQTAAKKCKEQHKSIIKLRFRAGHFEFVEEPVEVQKWGGELVENECTTVEVNEWSLICFISGLLSQAHLKVAYKAK